jgi:hypothetical protein
MKHSITLDLLPGTFAVARFTADAPVPGWADRGTFVSITRTPDELSIVCEEAAVPDDVIAQRGFRCLKVHGPLDFGLTGILASIAVPLAQAGISIFAISTYDTDYILLPAGELEAAIKILSHAGHMILGNSRNI